MGNSSFADCSDFVFVRDSSRLVSGAIPVYAMPVYSDFSDNDLQSKAKAGDKSAEEELALRYSRIVRMCARPLFLAGGDSEDLIQEGMFGLLSAIREFDADHGVTFKNFAEICVKRRLIEAVRSASRKKHTPLNNGVSLDEIHSDDNLTHAAFFGAVFRRIPEEQVLARESADEILSTYTRCLSKFEREVLGLYLEGMSYSDIARGTSRSTKSVDNAVQRIRRKLARYFNLSGFST